ncbi:MAG: SDR family oxidoreductase [Ignavibacteriales bacterium]|nr:SDR family oxidoreductase [Ignavibacteriales bacterium]
MNSLQNKTVIITGGTGALGSVVVQYFLKEKANVVVPYRNEKDVERFTSERNKQLLFCKTDLTNEDDVKQLFQQAKASFGAIDILINIAGGYSGGKSVADTSLEEIEKMFALNLKTAFLCSREFLKQAEGKSYGRIINIASKQTFKPTANASAYTISKMSVVALTQTIAEEMKSKGITANAIAPSVILTEKNKQWLKKEDYAKCVTPEEIAEAMIFLCSENARSINGAVIPMFGGM